MTSLIYTKPIWIRLLSLVVYVLWCYFVAAQFTYDSIITVILAVPLAAAFTYIAITQFVFLFRGNPPIVEVHDDVVIIRNLLGQKVYRRSMFKTTTSNWLLWNSLVLSDGTKKSTIVNGAEFSQKKFNSLRSELLAS